MNIIILGAGQVGGTLAESLVREGNDVTLIDRDADRLRDLQLKLDIRTINGHASHPHIIRQAGGEDADMIIAVTNSDETNMVGCQIAYALFRTPTKIARIRSNSYISYPELFQNKSIPIDVIISPEQLVTNYVQRLVEFPGALQVLDFADGKVQLVVIKPVYGGSLAKKTVADVYAYMPHLDMKIVGIFRRNRALSIVSHTNIEVGDEVFIIAAPKQMREVLLALGKLDNPNKRIMIAGGGNIGSRLAMSLEEKYNVKIVDHNALRTEILAQKLNKSIVLLGDASDDELLVNENIDNIDVFCALTNDDEANIMSCLQAKRLGARQAMALINRTAYADLVEGGLIDIAISPQQITIGSILTHLRRGDIVSVHSLRRGVAEAIEIVAHGDATTSRVVGRCLREIKLPRSTTIGAIVRGNETLIAHDDLIIQSEDHIVLFVVDKKSIPEVERLFQVNISYFG